MKLKITKRLRRHAVKTWKAAEDATDLELSKLYARKLVKGVITVDDIEKINAGEEAGKKSAATKTKPAAKKTTPAQRKQNARTPEQRKKRFEDRVAKAVAGALKDRGVGGNDIDPTEAMTKHTRIRVKEAAEGYSTSRRDAVYPTMTKSGSKMIPHPMAGQPAKCGEVTLAHPSDLDKAVSQAWLKWHMNRNNVSGSPLPRWCRMTDHDKELMMYAVHNQKWVGRIEDRDGAVQNVKRRPLSDLQRKTILDDSVSGGIEITPVVFDDALVLTPVLNGELFPFVNVVTVTKGRRVKGASMINPEFTSGTAEGTAITPFNTSSFVSAFDTPIYPAVSAIELGQDFEEDSPVDLGGQIVEQFGLKALEWLDRVIAVGNGFNEPQGFFNSTAATLVNSTYGAGGPFTVSDFEAMEFGVGKEYRAEAGAFMAYVSNDYTYRKARAIKVGEGDQRRVFGLDQQSYTLLGFPHKVQNTIPDGYCAMVNLRRYRMYRRLGMQVRVEMGGRQLALSNTRLIVVRMRYGGQLEKGAAAAIMKDGQVM